MKVRFLRLVPVFLLLSLAYSNLLPKSSQAQQLKPKYLFTSERDGNSEIYSMNTDGSEQINLTNNPADDGFAQWSRDGQKIFFISSRDDSGKAQIYSMDADGSNIRQLTDDGHNYSTVRVSPDGSKLLLHYLNKDGDSSFMAAVISTDGTHRVNFTDPNTGLDNGGVSWSPDSQKVLISRLEWGASNPNTEYTRLRLILSDVGGVLSRDLSSYDPGDAGAGIDIAPVWSPDGSKIASNFVLYPEAGQRDGSSTIRIYNANSSDHSDINLDFEAISHPQFPMLWLGDSKRIIATVAGPENGTNQRSYDLYLIDTTDLIGSTYVNLTDESDDNISIYARWPYTNLGSSVKQEIIFVSVDGDNPDSSADIYKMNTDGTNKVRLTNSPGNDIYWDDGGSNITPLETVNEPAVIPTAPKSGAVITVAAFSTVLIGSVILFAIIYKNNHLHKSHSEKL